MCGVVFEDVDQDRNLDTIKGRSEQERSHTEKYGQRQGENKETDLGKDRERPSTCILSHARLQFGW